jgi:hypothetical protein
MMFVDNFTVVEPVKSERDTVIYYVPHPDDETISMSVGIMKDIDEGKNVILVVYTGGMSTNVCEMINGKRYSNYWDGLHSPRREGYKELDRTELRQAREREMIDASLMLGVEKNNILFFPKAASEEKLRELMLDFNKRYPHAAHKAMSYNDSHTAHALGGRLLDELFRVGTLRDVTFFISRCDWQKQQDVKDRQLLVASSAQLPRLKKAVAAYFLWKPQIGRFAIGAHSVKNQFFELLHDQQNKLHKPGASVNGK